MQNLTHSQFILLVLLVSFVTSLATGIVTATLVNQAPSPITQTVGRVIEKTIQTVSPSLGEAIPEKEVVNVITQEELIIKLVKNVSPAVVSVIATKDIPVIEEYFVNPFGNDPFFQQIFPEGYGVPQYRQNGTEQKQVSSGSGFFVSSDGTILTNKHVVSDAAASYTVVTNDGKKYDAKILARDPLQDVAILKVEGEGFPFVELGNSSSLEVGQTVVAIGNTLGEFQNTVSVGVVSGLNRTVSANDSSGQTETLQNVIQTDAAINPGNSGGPLLDLNGRAIGINTALAQDAQSVGFALPINFAKKGITDAKEFGEIRYPFLGIRYVPVSDAIKKEKNLSVDSGLLIARGTDGSEAVMKGSPADKAGLKEGDIILEFNGTKINKNITLNELLSGLRVGDKIMLKILRGKDTLDVEITLDERPKNL
ncbi:MAG: trypsin-like peptidase domain-containing protein [Candidatus Pacebacteria bacterium]|nr:trypsin-like peptidase domain-containing protein [Candidatus Paceibacterota bacterium]